MIRSEWGKGNWRNEVQPRPPPNGSRGSREALTDIQEASMAVWQEAKHGYPAYTL